MVKEMIAWLLSVGIFLLYLKSSGQKLRNPYALQLVVEGYDVLSRRMVGIVAPLIAVTEFLAAIWIVLPWTRVVGALVGGILQMVFMILMVKNLGRTLQFGCGCFVLNQPKTISIRHVWINFILFLVMIIVVLLSWEGKQWSM